MIMSYANVHSFPIYKTELKRLEPNFSFLQTNDPIAAKCGEKLSAWGSKTFLSNYLCIQLNKYFEYYSKVDQSKTLHCEYLNYWLNDKIRKNPIESIYKNIIDPKTSSNIFHDNISHIKEYKSKLHKLEDDVFEKIDILNKLNEEYILFITKEARSNVSRNEVCAHSGEFVNIFNTAIIKCYDQYDKKYCKELEVFRDKYNTYAEFIKTCPNIESLKSPSKEYNSEISSYTQDPSTSEDVSYSASDIGVLVGKILGGCFVSLLVLKFTPLKSLLHFPRRKKKTDMDDIDYEIYGCYSPNYDYEETFQDTGEYNIQY
ncbi:PIR Superfamily Protein [Plasmodium ovale wallikeri]|uniref:PIR Superfamily Protein n=1 Tax=Plasmodium ovale wallikeri TaxID=864142 RepID=A0A1A9ARU8_PLAOA|nr:PIR Superfamily Protein [Plasmodium ovale wallikeri]